MKNICRIITYSLVMIMLLTTIASIAVPVSAEPGMIASWETDFETMDLVIKFKSPAEYNQTVVITMYPGNITNPSLSDYKRIKEVASVEGEETTVRIKIGEDIPSGVYKISLQGNGILWESSYKLIDRVSIFKPSEANGVLDAINAASDVLTLKTVLTNAKEELQIDYDDDNLPFFLDEKVIDYSNSFSNLNQVRDAYEISETLFNLHSSSVNVDGLKNDVEGNAALLNLNVGTEDYLKYRDSAYQRVINVKNTYQNTGIDGVTGVKTGKLLIKALKEMVAIETINNSDTSELAASLARHRSVIGITDSYYNNYILASNDDKSVILRQLYMKNFNSTAEIVKTFEEAVDSPGNGVTEEGGGTTDTPSGSIGGGSADIKDDKNESVDVPVDTQQPANFNDVSSSHWAYSYIDELRNIGIISGYPGNNFKPDNTVSREEFIKMIISATGLYDQTTTSSFEDVPSTHWAYQYVSSAKSLGIVNGITETGFGVGTAITREDVAVIVARIIDKFNNTAQSQASAASTGFVDDLNISDYARAGVRILVQSGIINGFDDNTFKPKDLLTRAQAAKIISILRNTLS